MHKPPAQPLVMVPRTYAPIAQDQLETADQIMAGLRDGSLSGFVLIAVGPETANWACGQASGRMDRMTLIGGLAMMQRTIEDVELADRS